MNHKNHNFLKTLNIKGKRYRLPIYLPDATRGFVKGLDSNDLKVAKVRGVVVNTFHLMNELGGKTLEDVGGIKKYMNWEGLVASDSGGFQIMSLVHQKKIESKLTDEGVEFFWSSKKKNNKFILTPEKSIQIQFQIGSDIVICLDDFSPVTSNLEKKKESVRRTIKWAKQCKIEFQRQIEERELDDKNRPLLFAVIQGGDIPDLRKKCAEELFKISFDGYGFGGWPFDQKGELNWPILDLTASLMPNDSPKFALGVGNPDAIIECYKMGYQIFDCVLPTRDGRHGRIYNFKKNPKDINIDKDTKIVEFVYITRKKYRKDKEPLSEWCDCYTCKNYSKGYVSHLFSLNDSLAGRLASIHNLRVYARLNEILV
jgi:queuine tRNA-ribosyltransferase